MNIYRSITKINIIAALIMSSAITFSMHEFSSARVSFFRVITQKPLDEESQLIQKYTPIEYERLLILCGAQADDKTKDILRSTCRFMAEKLSIKQYKKYTLPTNPWLSTSQKNMNFILLNVIWHGDDIDVKKSVVENTKKECFAYRYFSGEFGFFLDARGINKVRLLCLGTQSSEGFSLIEMLHYLDIKNTLVAIMNDEPESITYNSTRSTIDSYKDFKEFLSLAILLRKRKAFEVLVAKDVCGCLNYIDDNSLETRKRQNANKVMQDLLQDMPSGDVHTKSLALFDQWKKEECITKSTTLDWINHWVETGDFDSYYAEKYKELGGKTYAELSSAQK